MDTLVLGIGNILLQDEGVGVRVIEALRTRDLPPDVEILDGGTGVLRLLDVLSNRRKLIVVDAVQGGSGPGTIYRFTLRNADTDSRPPASLHQFGFLETLDLAECLGGPLADVVIIGVEPKTIDWGPDLTPEVSTVVPQVVELVLTELGLDETRVSTTNGD